MDIIERFHTALDLEAHEQDPALLPHALARTAAHVLSTEPLTAHGSSAAAELILIDPSQRLHHVPIGASTPEAATAESWQFTLGDSPCAAALDTGKPVLADEAAFRERWPLLHEQLRRHTPFRATFSLPLGRASACIGALTLYLHHPQPLLGNINTAYVVASLTHTALLEGSSACTAFEGPPSSESNALGTDPAQSSPAQSSPAQFSPAHLSPAHLSPAVTAWLDATPALRRHNVWMATGICSAALNLNAHDALALLRAYAFVHDQLVDDVADDIITGRTPIHTLQDRDHT
ncbi:hypothetical protein FHR75_004028 [Kineococcus radiotolerans]|uniref:GAF domain-containing protein n=1 Tax=Kineococcus radiotolerans TaxID=131568 RepID=A0A7W4TQD4_KINRA|nr:GAF domain-containing protein [Kineococcus radiotolerans]MBB2903186.1 hypothetical protein [Kineococcus radiotolerans]